MFKPSTPWSQISMPIAVTRDKLILPQWYQDLRKIRERISMRAKHLKAIAGYKTLIQSSLTDIDGLTICRMLHTLLLSYPILCQNDLEEWHSFRTACLQVYDLDNRRFVKYLRASLSAVFDYEALKAVGDAENPEIGFFTAPFDYVDKIITFQENKFIMPFSLLPCEDSDLSTVLKTIDSINIKNVIALWMEDDPSDVYIDVKELYKSLK